MSCSSNIIFLEYTWYWVEKVNRGGVIYVTDDFYKLIRKIKYTVRKVLNMKLIVAYAGENLRNVLWEKLKENKNLSEDWDLLRCEVSYENRASSYSKSGQVSMRKAFSSRVVSMLCWNCHSIYRQGWR